jgi:hypothetical protein
MTVYDLNGKEIGEVEDIYLGSVSRTADDYGAGAATTYDPDRTREDTFLEDIAEVFTDDDDMPDELRSHLLRHGYIRIDVSGLFARDRYATPDQIESVSDDSVYLNVSVDELIKR